MGWTSPYKSREEILERKGLHEGHEWVPQEGMRCRADHILMGASNIWFRMQVTQEGWQPYALIGMIRTRKEAGSWGEGGMWAETCGPIEMDCPLSLLDLVPDPVVGPETQVAVDRALEWRKQMRALAVQKRAGSRAQASLEVGDRVVLPATFSVSSLTVTDRKGRKVLGVTDGGARYRITPRVVGKGAIVRKAEMAAYRALRDIGMTDAEIAIDLTAGKLLDALLVSA